MRKLYFFCVLSALFLGHIVSAQSTVADNNPVTAGAGAHLGWDDNLNSPLWINQNNLLRLRFTSVNWLGLNVQAPHLNSRK